ncbi:MAG: hypothetical protein ABSF54_14640 [Bryobacteraceae bacterium]
MTFSDLEVVLALASRAHGYARDNILNIWTPGGGTDQKGYSRELAGALLREADVFFDRALVLYLLRSHLKSLQASTWAGVASYYSNYFSALSFIRLNLCSVTHMPGGGLFAVEILSGGNPYFSIRSRTRRLGHTDVWNQYYSTVRDMAWPDSNIVTNLAPTHAALQFREQLYRERINYRPGEGFQEIYLVPPRYRKYLKMEFQDTGLGYIGLTDAGYAETMAIERLRHVAALLRRLKTIRQDKSIEQHAWENRRAIVERYSSTTADIRSATDLLPRTQVSTVG